MNPGKDIVEDLIATIEKQTEQKIFTIKVLERNHDEESIEVLVVFEDKSVLMGRVLFQQMNGMLACRVQGNYI